MTMVPTFFSLHEFQKTFKMEMTPTVLRDIATKANLYRTPEMNDKLYLHYRGFKAIQSLERYTGKWWKR